METDWIIARTRLWQLLQEHPEFTTAELAQQLGYCVAWVRKWRRRLRERDPNDPQRFCSVSRRPHHVQKQVSKVVEARIVHLRHALATLYNRKVGGKTIAYYLRQQAGPARTLPAALGQHYLAGTQPPPLHPAAGAS